MKDILRAIITFLRRLPIAAWIKPLWKGALRAVVQSEGDALQARLRTAIGARGPAAVDAAFDAAQSALLLKIDAL